MHSRFLSAARSWPPLIRPPRRRTLQWTVRNVVPLTPFSAAVMVVEPVAAELARPNELITATLTWEDDHVTWLVKLRDVPSLKWPVAANCSLVPRAISGLLGEIVMELRVTLVVLTVELPTMPANTAVSVARPRAMPVTDP